MEKKWWKEAVVYQIYPKSFKDSNNDGVGDLQGILEKLDYIADLGVDVIWLNPIYQSPQVDNGYDISDYRKINPLFGTMDDFDQLLQEVHKRGMRLIMDMVLNHISDQHIWFKEAIKSKNNPYHEYFIWQPAKNGKEPNNWGNYFYEGRGSAWEWNEATGEYYLHQYSKHMPDLNWESPKLKAEMIDMLTWWCEKGIDGFRLDAVNRLVKPKGFPDSHRPPTPPVGVNGFVVDREMCANCPGIHELLHELNQKVFSKYNLMTVGETGNLKSDIAIDYVNEEREEINMLFHFEIAKNQHLVSVSEFKDIQKRWYKVIEQNGWITQYLSNHDSPRQVSRFADDKEYRIPSAKMLAILIHTLPGTPYVYQGEEIGMTNVDFPTIDYYNEQYTVGKYHTMVEKGKDPQEALDSLKMMSRDNVRTPMHWNNNLNAGFSEGKPWLAVNPNYSEINVEKDKKSEESIRDLYKTLIKMRKKYELLVYGNYQPILEDYDNIVAYTRSFGDEKWLMIFNFQKQHQQVVLPKELINSKTELLLANYEVNANETKTTHLKPYEARVYKVFSEKGNAK
ncbi:glycoside hydrolase family 13 protein [Tetragenococcus solitarius]|uniref:Oligo-1,6-glucosidase n=1 Tax=Tetragenococcus solitarius TaxID=71453 RepID=A0ABN3YAM6_9ENTE|nr:alpha-glucosidase [Tetragenococcus solitarius]